MLTEQKLKDAAQFLAFQSLDSDLANCARMLLGEVRLSHSQVNHLKDLLEETYAATGIIGDGRCVFCRQPRHWTPEGARMPPEPCSNDNCITHLIDEAIR